MEERQRGRLKEFRTRTVGRSLRPRQGSLSLGDKRMNGSPATRGVESKGGNT